MLQEFREATRAAAEVLAAVGARFELGDPAEDLLQCLAVRLAELERRVLLVGEELPPEYREAIEQLLTQLQDVVRDGEGWLTQSDAMELTPNYLRQRLRQVYGIAARNE